MTSPLEESGTPAPKEGAEARKPAGIPAIVPVAVAVFLGTVSASAYLWYQTGEASRQAESVRSENAALGSAIAELRADPSVLATDLVERNRALLESSVDRSKAQDYANEFMRLRRDYSVDFAGFTFAGNKISTVVHASSESGSTDPVDRVIRFIGDFRSGSGSAAESPLSLGEVRLVTGEANARSFAVEFEVKKPVANAPAKSPNAQTDATDE